MSDKMREEFETEVKKQLPHVIPARTPAGTYLSSTIQAAWWGWNASRESLVIELPASARMYFNGAPAEAYTDGVKCWHGGVDAARLAIESAGLKVKP